MKWDFGPVILVTTWENSHMEMAQRLSPGAERALRSGATSFYTPSFYHTLPEDEDPIPLHQQPHSQEVVDGEGVEGREGVRERTSLEQMERRWMEMDRARADRMDQQQECWFQFMAEHLELGERVASPPPRLILQKFSEESDDMGAYLDT